MEYIATIKRTNEILQKYNQKAKKKYGQNFIIEPMIIDKIVRSANIKKDTPVVEIGPGIGALTQQLALKTEHLTCFEIDEDMIHILQNELDLTNITLIHQDFLKSDLKLAPHTKVVANLPYYITSKLIEKLALNHACVDEMYLMVQKEVAYKLAESDDLRDRLPLRVLLETLGRVEYLFDIPAQVFLPKPHVDSAIIKITFNHQESDDIASYYLFLKKAFTSRRKKLKNNIQVDDATLLSLGYPSDVRAEQMVSEDFMKLYQQLGGKS